MTIKINLQINVRGDCWTTFPQILPFLFRNITFLPLSVCDTKTHLVSFKEPVLKASFMAVNEKSRHIIEALWPFEWWYIYILVNILYLPTDRSRKPSFMSLKPKYSQLHIWTQTDPAYFLTSHLSGEVSACAFVSETITKKQRSSKVSRTKSIILPFLRDGGICHVICKYALLSVFTEGGLTHWVYNFCSFPQSFLELLHFTDGLNQNIYSLLCRLYILNRNYGN